MAIKQYDISNLKSALYEILNCARICESHPNIVNLRGV
jgi:hypothetical protein